MKLLTYKVIYDLIDDVRAAMEGRLSAVEEREPIGSAEVRAIFGTGSRRVAGCMVTDGVLRRDATIMVTTAHPFLLARRANTCNHKLLPYSTAGAVAKVLWCCTVMRLAGGCHVISRRQEVTWGCVVILMRCAGVVTGQARETQGV